MAATSVHAGITKREMARFGFSDRACEMAATANKRVDEKQGNSPEETHLHAMRGMVRDASGQPVPEAGEAALVATRKLVEGAQTSLIDAIRELAGVSDQRQRSLRSRAIVESLGCALHTVQDMEFHAYGIWRHDGIFQALISDLLGTGLHAVHDLGRTEATVESASNRGGRWGVAVDIGVVPSRRMSERGVGFFVQGAVRRGGGEREERLAVGGIRIGGGFSGVRQPPPRGGSLGYSDDAASLQTMRGLSALGRASSGPVANVLNRAEQATREFLRQIEQATGLLPSGQRPWADLVSLTRGWA